MSGTGTGSSPSNPGSTATPGNGPSTGPSDTGSMTTGPIPGQSTNPENSAPLPQTQQGGGTTQ
jgi:hypothetical protein